MELLGSYIIPILYIYFAFRYLRRPAAYGDREGFSSGRAKESEETWSFAQRAAGVYCVCAGVALAVMTYAMTEYAPENRTLFWVRVGIEVASIALLIPAVNTAVNLKFPKKQ